jgi:DNA ligase (NAD+)
MCKSLKLGLGDKITVYKANMIIPQIAENLTCSDTLEIPKICPVCGGATEVRSVNEAQFLYCTNEACDAKSVKAFTLFVSRDAMNIDGMSEATLEKFIDSGFLQEFADLYHLDRYEDEIVNMEGFGEKSYKKLQNSIEASRETTLPRVLYALGIAGIGVATAKVLCKEFSYDLEKLMNATEEELSTVEGIGEVIAAAFVKHMQREDNRAKIENLMKELKLQEVVVNEAEQSLSGLSFCITGSLNHFENRDALKEIIEQKGGKVTGSVTSKTHCLINNDITSGSGKNKKAKELQIPILTEEEFMVKYLSIEV